MSLQHDELSKQVDPSPDVNSVEEDVADLIKTLLEERVGAQPITPRIRGGMVIMSLSTRPT